jgi:hypothetical protein
MGHMARKLVKKGGIYERVGQIDEWVDGKDE